MKDDEEEAAQDPRLDDLKYVIKTILLADRRSESEAKSSKGASIYYLDISDEKSQTKERR